jgi:FkbM family methyltransferase
VSRKRRHPVEQRHRLAKRVVLGPTAPAVQRWALSGEPTERKAFAVRRFVVPPLAAAAKDFERHVEPGFTFAGNTRDLLGLMVYLFGVWEPNLSTFLRHRLRPGDTFINVGANSGWYTAMGAQLVGPTGSVVGIEASPSIAARLQDNLERNGCTHARLVVAAATSEPCVVDIVPGPAEHTGLTHIDKNPSSQTMQVRGDTLPNLLTQAEIASVRVVKIDVEGAEYDVVAGLRPVLQRFPETCEFVVEVGPERAADPRDVAVLLEAFTQAGFRPYVLPNFYDVRNYMLKSVVDELPTLTEPPVGEVDIVFSRQGGATLAL